jgi:hypothetical protein
MPRHVDNIPVEEAKRIIRELNSYPTWALEVALITRTPAWSDFREQVATRLGVPEYLELAEKVAGSWNGGSTAMPAITRDCDDC